jgi:UDP-N-acetylglucosamine:LPS N-acetylglucosamine transferase
LTLFYGFFLTVIARSEDGVAYACKTLVTLGYAVCAEILIVAYNLHINDNLFINVNGYMRVNRTMLVLSWGLPTIIGAVFAVAICGCLYLARSRKFPLFSYFSAVFFWLVSVLIDTRSAIIFGGLALVVGIFICCIDGNNKKKIRIVSAVIFFIGLIFVLWILIFHPEKGEGVINKLLLSLRLDVDVEKKNTLTELIGARVEIWRRGLQDFLKAPVFGSGFMSGEYGPDTVYNNMYHNIFIEFLGSMGIFGIFAFAVHLKHLLEATIRRYSLDKLLLLGVPLCILGMSLVDNFFFYPNFHILYAAFLACAEVSLEHKRLDRLNNLNRPKKGEKPRVAFTFVEAGMGHIIPTRTVCDAFKRKYGDRVEVIESKFFTETGNPDMQKTENLFTKAVKNQSRSPVISILCKIGNLIAGDSFALQVLLSQTVSGRKTAPLAVKHISEIDAHVVYSAHWAIPYYVNKMKSPRPYVICFCPDVYSNGAFDVDCNNFLISTDPGYKKIARTRMYAGGNISKIPFPERPEISELKKADKSELRRSLGLREDTFTVALSDGGYGMARLGSTVKHLVKSADIPMTIIALCGLNEKLRAELDELSHHTPEHIDLVALGFTDKITQYLAASDIYAGKSGANSIAEPASLGVPIIVTKCATYIEKGIKNYYVKTLKGAMYIPSARRAARKICKLANNREKLEKYRQNLLNTPSALYDAEASADLIWQRVCELGVEEG